MYKATGLARGSSGGGNVLYHYQSSACSLASPGARLAKVFSSLARLSFLPLPSVTPPPSCLWHRSLHRGELLGLEGRCAQTDEWNISSFYLPLISTALQNPLYLLKPIIHSLLTLPSPKHLCWFLVLTPKHLRMSLLLQQFWIFWFQEWKWCKPFHTHPQKRQISTMSVLLRNPEPALIKKRWRFQSFLEEKKENQKM